MHSSKIALIACVTSLIALAGAAAGKADAATKYAGPGSTLVSGSCTDQSDPCRIDYAATQSNSGDTLIALPGVHVFAPANSTYISLSGVTLKSLPGAPMATIKQTVAYANSCNCPTLSAYGATVIDRIKIENDTPPSAGAVGFSDTVTITNSILEGASGGAYTFHAAGPKGSFHGNVVRAHNGFGLYLGSGGMVDVAQSTIWSGSSYALRIDSTSTPSNVSVHNTVLHGASQPAQLFSAAGQTINATFDHSAVNVGSVLESGAGSSAIDGGGNQAADPLLADPASGDFHQLAASPTVNHGSAPFSGADIDGNVFGADGTPDIGAYEYTVAPVGPVQSGDAGSAVATSVKALAGARLKLSARKKGKITATVTCPKAAVTSCSGRISLLQGKKTKTIAVKAIKPGRTAKLRIKAKKGKAVGSLTLNDASGAAGVATAKKTLH